MKRICNLYNKITNIKNIADMYDKKISINTKNKNNLAIFDEYYASNIARIKEILERKNYKPYKYNIFLIREPKVRLIMAQSITDKIINHLVSKYFLVEVFEPMLIINNIAITKVIMLAILYFIKGISFANIIESSGEYIFSFMDLIPKDLSLKLLNLFFVPISKYL